MHDFGGPAGTGAAIRHPDRIKRIVSVNGRTPAGQPDLIERLTANVSDSPWFQWILKAENEGILEQVLDGDEGGTCAETGAGDLGRG